MLIVPVFNKTDTKLPYICIALIIINIFIYFFIQSGDSQIRQEAYAYYETSRLIDIETRAYQNYLIEAEHNIPQEIFNNEQDRYDLTSRMFSDQEFQKLLTDNKVIQATHSEFKKWREKRDHFEKIEHRTVIYQYGYSPQRRNLIGLFTCTFLHGGVMHLVGNMVFLWLVGAILEKAIGATLFLVLYIVTGIAASGLFGIVYPLSLGPLVGASGAIAGLMGAFGVIFSLRKIRVFWSVGFYFNYSNVPAITLFPMWLANELFQLLSHPDSRVAYVAHIGGLLSGILLGAGFRYTRKSHIETLFHKEGIKNKLKLLLDSGLKKMLELNFAKARIDFCRVLEIDPKNRSAIRQLFAIDKTSPNSEEFHQSAHRLLQSIQTENQDEFLKTFEEYRTTTKKPQVSMEILERLTHCYLTTQNIKKASSCLSTMIKRAPENAKIPGFLMTLAHSYNSCNRQEQERRCYKLLATKYPTTIEGTKADEHLKRF